MSTVKGPLLRLILTVANMKGSYPAFRPKASYIRIWRGVFIRCSCKQAFSSIPRESRQIHRDLVTHNSVHTREIQNDLPILQYSKQFQEYPKDIKYLGSCRISSIHRSFLGVQRRFPTPLPDQERQTSEDRQELLRDSWRQTLLRPCHRDYGGQCNVKALMPHARRILRSLENEALRNITLYSLTGYKLGATIEND